MEVCIKYLDARDEEYIEDVEDVTTNAQMGLVSMIYKERERLIAEGEPYLYTDKTFRKQKLLNFAVIKSIVITEEE